MSFKKSILAIALVVALSGCEQQAKRPVQVRPPEVTSAPVVLPESLPLNSARAQAPSLATAPRPAVEILIEQVEAAFLAGEENRKGGDLEKARRDLDRALAGLLSSGLDLRADPRLEQLFERVVQTIHSLEASTVQEGEGFAEQRAEPAAIDEIAAVTFPADPRLKEKAERELLMVPHDLPLAVNDQVVSYLNFFQTPRGRAILEKGLRRSGRYAEMISRILREEGLPQDLIYVAQAESAFQPLALSRAGARGMWQFMSFRAREYGLRRTWWIDERLDPEQSTRAAARHFRDLYEIFGDWYLALAAYNSGPGNVARAIERTGYADFWELYNRRALPRETKNYVPIIMALTLMAKDAARYGVQVEPDAPVSTDRVKPGHAIDLRLVAETVDVSVETLRLLNPQLLRMVTPSDPEFELHLPQGTAERFLTEIASIPAEKWVSWRRHRVREGETLSSIAGKYRVTTRAIAAVNGFDHGTPIQVGDKLTIPAMARPQTGQGKLVRYRVRRGDTLNTIAEQFDVRVADLKRWNGIRGDRVARGLRLIVYPGGRPPAAKRKPPPDTANSTEPKVHIAKGNLSAASDPIFHRVSKGETLWSIARAYQTSVEALRNANRFLLSREVQAGDRLAIVPSR